MKPFRFQKFEILQDKDVFRVGTDGVLLGAFSEVSNAKKILEIGTGTGLIALMLAQRNPKAKILAIDIDEKAVELAQNNFKNSPFSERLKAELQDFKKSPLVEKFDLIVSNPPYFAENASHRDIIARQKVELDFEILISKSFSLLAENGILSIIIPEQMTDEFEKIGLKFNLYVNRTINIFGIKGGKLKRNILEFSLHPKEIIQQDFIIEDSSRKYSKQYLELTKDFHVFSK